MRLWRRSTEGAEVKVVGATGKQDNIIYLTHNLCQSSSPYSGPAQEQNKGQRLL